MYSRNEKLDPKCTVLDGPSWADELVQALFRHWAVATCFGVHFMILAGCFAIYGDTKAERLSGFYWSQDEMKIAGVKPKVDTTHGESNVAISSSSFHSPANAH
jgi:hypothetical protein